MKKFRVILFLLFMIFVLNGYSMRADEPHHSSFQDAGTEDLAFTSSDIFFYNLGEIPTGYVFLNSGGSTSNTLTDKLKIRTLGTQHSHFLSKVKINYFVPQGPVFSRYSSTIQQIYLKTACFRL